MRVTRYTVGKEITLAVDEEEFEPIKAALSNGAYWLRNHDGKAQALPAYDPPGTVEDALQLSFHWGANLELPTYFRTEGARGYLPAIYVQGISGYDGHYLEKAEQLEAAGFDVLRSRRGKDGSVWEVWYLPSVMFARGPIEDFNMDDVVAWLQFLGVGSITIGGDHWGLGVD
jgi:hypothetical protein